MTKNPEEGVATERPQDSPPAVEEKEPPSFHRAEQPTEHPPPATPEETKRADDLTEPEDSLQPTPNPAITNGEENDKDLQQTDDTEDKDQLPKEGAGEGEEVEEQKAEEGEEQEEKLKEEGEEDKEEQNADEKEGEEQEDKRNLEEGKEEDDQEEEREEDKKGEETVEEQEQEGEEEETLEEREQEQIGEEEKEEEKGDDSQLSGIDVSSMDGKGDSTEVSPRRETSDLKTEGNDNESAADSKPEVNGPTGDGDHSRSPTPEAAAQPSPRDSRTEEDSAPVEETGPKGEAETGEQASENTSETPAPHYEDDFSEASETSDRGAAVTTETAGAAPEETKPELNKSPTPSTEESRAERGSVVPVPVNAQKKSRDGRSFVEERGERRGEDRSEVPCEEGVDSRGQGQWKSEEKLFLETSLANQHAEKEALQAVIDDKVKVQKEFDDLKNRYVTLEEKSRRWEEDTSSLKQACQDQNLRIRELEEEQTRLKAFEQWGKDNEARIKDLQDRLGALAGEDADKDRRIQKLQEELQDTRSRLVTAERQVAVNNEASQQRPAQQSKTCTIL